MTMIATTKIEYRSEKTGETVTLLAGTEVPADMATADVKELTKWGSIASEKDYEQAMALIEAEQRAEGTERVATAARQVADDAAEAARTLHVGDKGTGRDTRR